MPGSHAARSRACRSWRRDALPVREVMSRAPVTIELDAPMSVAAARALGVRGMLIADRGDVRGIATGLDFTGHLAPV
jgi:CBS domain-containing protein